MRRYFFPNNSIDTDYLLHTTITAKYAEITDFSTMPQTNSTGICQCHEMHFIKKNYFSCAQRFHIIARYHCQFIVSVITLLIPFKESFFRRFCSAGEYFLCNWVVSIVLKYAFRPRLDSSSLPSHPGANICIQINRTEMFVIIVF